MCQATAQRPQCSEQGAPQAAEEAAETVAAAQERARTEIDVIRRLDEGASTLEIFGIRAE